MSSLENLPKDILIDILGYLPTRERSRVLTSNRTLNVLDKYFKPVSYIENLDELTLFTILDQLSANELGKVLSSSKYISWRMRQYFEDKIQKYKNLEICPQCNTSGSIDIYHIQSRVGDESFGRMAHCTDCPFRKSLEPGKF